MLYFFSPFSKEKNLFDAYDSHIKIIPDKESWVVLSDLDVCFLTPDAPLIIEENIARYPDVALFSCMTNRVGEYAQLYDGRCSYETNMIPHIRGAEILAKTLRHRIKYVDHPISGMVLILQKKTWDHIAPIRGILGVDNHITQSVLDFKGRVAIMEGLYVWHTYRIASGIDNKTHLI